MRIHLLVDLRFLKQILLKEDVPCVTSLMEVCKDRDTFASRILNVFRHQEQHHNLLKRLAEKEIETEGKTGRAGLEIHLQ